MTYRTFAPGNPLPSTFVNEVQEFMASFVSDNLALTQANDNTLQVVAGAGDEQRSITVQSLFRQITATITAGVPGTPAPGELDVWVTTNPNVFTTTGGGEVDNTNYAFFLKITVPPATPNGVGQESFYRKIATVTWNGSRITRITPIAKLAASPDATPGVVPIGGMLAYAGTGDPVGGNFLLAEGRLIDRTVFSRFFQEVQHAYNGGVDPGAGMVRIPDKRGRASIGADNMGTAQGAAGRVPNSNRVIGQNGGEERHQLIVAELAAHPHTAGTLAVPSSGPHTHQVAGGPNATDGIARMDAGFSFYQNTEAGQGAHVHPSLTGSVSSAGTDAPHNNMQPYEVDNVIVRVL